KQGAALMTDLTTPALALSRIGQYTESRWWMSTRAHRGGTIRGSLFQDSPVYSRCTSRTPNAKLQMFWPHCLLPCRPRCLFMELAANLSGPLPQHNLKRA